MKRVLVRLLSVCLLALGTKPAVSQETQIVGRVVSHDPDILVSFVQPDPDYDIPGDMFGIRSRDMPDVADCLVCPGIPVAMLDQTADASAPRPLDRLGLIRSNDFDPFFGVVDTANDSGERLNAASWTFDVAGFTDLRISVDMAAMGDFEAGNIERATRDAYAWDYSIDSSPFEMLFESSVDTEASLDYEMELPHPDQPVIVFDDPLAINGVTLSNVFQTLSAPISGAGERLELRFRAIADGADEVFAFRNLLVEAIVNNGGGVDGDYNGNGSVEQSDLDLVLLHWGREGPPPVGWINDLPTGTIDQSELDGVLLNWGNRSPAGRLTAHVPEPTTLVTGLYLIVLLSLAPGRVSQ